MRAHGVAAWRSELIGELLQGLEASQALPHAKAPEAGSKSGGEGSGEKSEDLRKEERWQLLSGADEVDCS